MKMENRERNARLYTETMPRCTFCKIKSALEFECLCKGVFCVRHRLPEAHKCTSDHSSKENLEKTLVKVVSDKMPERL